MTKFVVVGPGIKTKTLRTKQAAKKYIHSSLKAYGIMGLSATINTVNKNGSGKIEQYFTSSGDKNYVVRGPVKTQKYKKK